MTTPILKSVIDFSMRSKYATQRIPGMPPALTPMPVVKYKPDGTPVIGGVPLTPAPKYVAPENVDTPIRISDGSKYGEALTIPVVFGAAGERTALVRPSGSTRISLLIQNFSVVGNVFYCFDRVADATTCVAIGAGGNRLFDDAIPQGDLHIFSVGAGTVIVEYMNRNIDAVNAR